MNLLVFIFAGGLTGYWVYFQFKYFAIQVTNEVYQAYYSLFEQTVNVEERQITELSSPLKPIKCGRFFTFFIGFVSWFLLCYWLFEEAWQSGYVALYLSVLFCIAVLDLHYQLIAPQFCQSLFALGVAGAWFNITEQTLEETLFSAFIGFTTFYLIYQLGKFAYKKEVLGRGDYWLMLGLGSAIHWQYFPVLVLFACLAGLVYTYVVKRKGLQIQELPFGTFLCGSGAILLLWLNLN
ncbi:TPA: prepilin peptidase [Pasteurella multocida]|nr:prepilin peptidase [Pasteurella multocida]